MTNLLCRHDLRADQEHHGAVIELESTGSDDARYRAPAAPTSQRPASVDSARSWVGSGGAIDMRVGGVCYGVTRWQTVLEWLPDDGVVLSFVDHMRIFEDLRALIAGSDELDPTRAFAVDIAVVISDAIERQQGDH